MSFLHASAAGEQDTGPRHVRFDFFCLSKNIISGPWLFSNFDLIGFYFLQGYHHHYLLLIKDLANALVYKCPQFGFCRPGGSPKVSPETRGSGVVLVPFHSSGRRHTASIGLIELSNPQKNIQNKEATKYCHSMSLACGLLGFIYLLTVISDRIMIIVQFKPKSITPLNPRSGRATPPPAVRLWQEMDASALPTRPRPRCAPKFRFFWEINEPEICVCFSINGVIFNKIRAIFIFIFLTSRLDHPGWIVLASDSWHLA